MAAPAGAAAAARARRVGSVEEASAALSQAEREEAALLQSVLLEGATFLKYGKKGQPRYKNVRCNTSGKEMRLEWTPLVIGNDAEDAGGSIGGSSGAAPDEQSQVSFIKLREVTMLLKGKHSKVFKRKAASTAPDFLCFSVVTKKRTLDLQAASGNQRDLWVRAITAMVTQLHARRVSQMAAAAGNAAGRSPAASPSAAGLRKGPAPPGLGRADVEERQRRREAVQERQRARIEASDSSSSISEASEREDTEEMKMLQFLTAGGVLVKHGRKGQPKQKHIFSAKGKLIWMDPKKKHNGANAKSFVMLNQVKGVLLGKSTEVLTRSAARKVPSGQLFSVITDDRTLDLQCPDVPARNFWVKCIRFATRNAQEKQQLLRTILNQSTSSVSGVARSESELSVTDDRSVNGSIADGAAGGGGGGSSTGSAGRAARPALSADSFKEPDAAAAAEEAAGAGSPPPPPPPPMPEAAGGAEPVSKLRLDLVEAEQKEQAARERRARGDAPVKSRVSAEARAQAKARKAAKSAAKAKAEAERRKRRAEEAEQRAAAEAEQRAAAEAKAREQTEALAATRAEAQAQAQALTVAQQRAEAQAQALEKAHQQVKELEHALRRASIKEDKLATFREDADAKDDGGRRGGARGDGRDGGGGDNDDDDDDDDDDDFDEEDTTTGDLSPRDSFVSAPAWKHHSPRMEARPSRSALRGSTSSLALNAPPRSQEYKKGVRWKQEIAEVKEVESIILLAADYFDVDYGDDDDDDDSYYSDEDEDDDYYEDEEDDDEDDDERYSTHGNDEGDTDDEDAPRDLRPVEDPRAFFQAVSRARAGIETNKADWNERIQHMKSIEQAVLDRDILALGKPWWDEMKLLRKALAVQLNDLRSSIVREACQLLITLAGLLGPDERFSATMKHCFPVLFSRLYVTIKVISDSADDCVRAVLSRAYHWSFKATPEILKAAQSDQHSVVRARCVEYLTQILNECPDDQFSSVFVYEKPLANLLKKNIKDQDKTVRAATRQLFLAFANVWPQLAHKLYDGFSAATQRTITSELKKMMD